ncbi:unnamed protein product [Coffea canephora]|uniref:DH200=94 genomic scaffold, scaffold_7970 n=1 Tax=Coffea canephora TaxID=49390 RepID=A0A068VMB0_COFCA|nr:unnamed protein product [Coffea canephora]
MECVFKFFFFLKKRVVSNFLLIEPLLTKVTNSVEVQFSRTVSYFSQLRGIFTKNSTQHTIQMRKTKKEAKKFHTAFVFIVILTHA